MSKHYKPKNSLMSPRFSGVKTFMRMELVEDESVLDDVDFAVLGIPFDTCATFRVGCRQGPASIREMSALAAKPYSGPLGVDIFEECSGVDYGDLGSVPGYVEDSFDVIKQGMLPIFQKGVIPVAMGGDHSVTLPELRACAEVNGPVALIHFDAHYDTIDKYFGKDYTHGTPFYHAAKEGLVDTSKSIQVGIIRAAATSWFPVVSVGGIRFSVDGTAHARRFEYHQPGSMYFQPNPARPGFHGAA